MKKTLLLFVVAALTSKIFAQENEHEAAILFGLSQPIFLSGFNIEGNYFTKKMSFDYSHGISLEYQGSMITGAAKE